MDKNFLKKLKILRDKSGASVIACKCALKENSLDIEKSILFLEKSSAINALKKEFRQVSSGLIGVLVDDAKKSAVILEVNCETDFVSKSHIFKSYVFLLLNFFLHDISKKNFVFLDNDIKLSDTMEREKLKIISQVGENIVVKRVMKVSVFSGEKIFSYAHGGLFNFGNICNLVVVRFNSQCYSDLVVDIAMQIAAMNPKYLNIENISFDILLKEKKISFKIVKKKYFGESMFILDNFINSRIQKFYSDVVLLEQRFVKDENLYVKDIIFDKFKVIKFFRFKIGEKHPLTREVS